jgi:AcrB/AcrD/AcrF family
MWIVRLALRRPYTIAVLCALIAIFGVLSVSRMKTDILPAIDIPVVIVVWNYPGLSTEDHGGSLQQPDRGNRQSRPTRQFQLRAPWASRTKAELQWPPCL